MSQCPRHSLVDFFVLYQVLFIDILLTLMKQTNKINISSFLFDVTEQKILKSFQKMCSCTSLMSIHKRQLALCLEDLTGCCPSHSIFQGKGCYVEEVLHSRLKVSKFKVKFPYDL